MFSALHPCCYSTSLTGAAGAGSTGDVPDADRPPKRARLAPPASTITVITTNAALSPGGWNGTNSSKQAVAVLSMYVGDTCNLASGSPARQTAGQHCQHFPHQRLPCEARAKAHGKHTCTLPLQTYIAMKLLCLHVMCRWWRCRR